MGDTKIYDVGFYGGKFLPFHKGHDYCIRTASKQCKLVHVILFYGGDDELNVMKNLPEDERELLSLENRMNRLKTICKNYDNVLVHLIDVTNVKNPDGSEDWDGETPLVLAITGKMDAVYSSEPSYDEYFKRAYPWATHILVDPPRITYPISGTKIRNMKSTEEKQLWML
jgi:HTH-type transcriptional repressor of NAD biosynthesis genes